MSSTFLGTITPRVPYVIGVAGSVAVGKSTFARILQALLARWPDHPNVGLVTTDGFLYPNKVLKARGLMERKGFPESYDTKRLLAFLRDIKSGAAEVSAPLYSHVVYDVIEGEELVVHRPDILILEGLNVLQVGHGGNEFVSDYFDFSIYLDADEADICDWFVQRFMKLRETVFHDPNSFFQHFAVLSDEEAIADGRGDLGGHQRPQPAPEHRADAGAGVADPAQGSRAPRHRGPPAQALATRLAWPFRPTA